MGSAVRMGRRKRHPGFADAPGVSITSSQAAAAHADGRPHRDSTCLRRGFGRQVRIDRIAQFRYKLRLWAAAANTASAAKRPDTKAH
jgi:hypothetical protein